MENRRRRERRCVCPSWRRRSRPMRRGVRRRSPRDRSRRRSNLRRAATAAFYPRPIWPPIARCGGAGALRGLRLAGGFDAAAVIGGHHSRPDLRPARTPRWAKILGSGRTDTTCWQKCGVARMPIVTCSATRGRAWRAQRSSSTPEAGLDLRAAEIKLGNASDSEKVQPWSRDLAPESAETTHLSVIDGDGNAVSLTTTLNGTFGCGLVVRGAGFLLNNEMDDFATAPGRPNLYGLIQGEANSVGPGKRMLSSMTPTIAWRGQEVIVTGSPGGSRIPTATAQVLLNLIVDGDELQAAVDRARVHHQWMPDLLFVEPDALSPETAKALERRGHELRTSPPIGEVSAVRGTAESMQAAQDPRGPGSGGVVKPAVD